MSWRRGGASRGGLVIGYARPGMADDTKTRRPWRALFSRRSESGAPTAPTRETGYRDPFVEVPGDRFPDPPTPEARQRETFAKARSHLTTTQCSDSVEDLTTSIEQLREGIARVNDALPDVYISTERIGDVRHVDRVEQIDRILGIDEDGQQLMSGLQSLNQPP